MRFLLNFYQKTFVLSNVPSEAHAPFKAFGWQRHQSVKDFLWYLKPSPLLAL